MTLKPGDRVKVLELPKGAFPAAGQTGTVVEPADRATFDWRVQMDDGPAVLFREDELEVIDGPAPDGGAMSDDELRWEHKVVGRLHDEFDPDAEPGRWMISDHVTGYETAVHMADTGNGNAMNMEHRVFRRKVGKWELVEDYTPPVLFGGRQRSAER